MITVFARLEVQNKRRALHVQSRQDVVWFPGLDISPCSIVLGLRGPSEKTLLFDSDREKAVQELGMAFCLLSGRLAACWR